MSTRITRRHWLGTGIKAGFAAALWNELRLGTTQASVFTPASTMLADDPRFQGALARLDGFIAAHMRDIGAPGMTLALATHEGLLRASTYGLADLKSGSTVKPETLFEIGSISKSFVALSLLQMREEGKFDPGKPITTYLPWLKIDSSYAPITGHHLLSHSSGLPDGVPLELIGPDQPLWTGFAPGEHFAYSNVGYDLLGLVLETIDRQPMAAVLRRRVLDPLGMKSSEPVITNAIRPRMAVGYAPMFDDRPFRLRGPLAEAPWVEFGEGAGSISSAAGDMGAYLAMLINRGAIMRGKSEKRQSLMRDRIVSEESFKLFAHPVIKAPFWGQDASYGYGLWTSEADGLSLLRHTGGMVAFSSALHVDLTNRIGAFASVNANLSGYRPNVVTKYALDLLRAAMNGKELPPAPSTDTRPDQIANASDFAGTFQETFGSKLELVADGAKLWLVLESERVQLERAGGADRFIVKHPDFELFALEFSRANNVVTEASHGPRWFRNQKYTGADEVLYPIEWNALAGHYRNDSPWFGSARVFVRKGRLMVDGAPLTSLGNGYFRVGVDDWSPERVSFGPIINGRCTRIKVSGVEFYRTFTP
jgi:CubicO group peptidase (beta-lactamase class C family)